jgi:hypothetical protein
MQIRASVRSCPPHASASPQRRCSRRQDRPRVLQINNYFSQELSIILARKEQKRREALAKKRRNKKPIRFLKPLEPSEADRKWVKWKAIHKFPQIIDYYLAEKEKHGDKAVRLSRENVKQIQTQFVKQVETLVGLLKEHSNFYSEPTNSYEAALKRALYLKDVLEHNDGWRIFYLNGQPITREKDVHTRGGLDPSIVL